jgi:hypothetical protein
MFSPNISTTEVNGELIKSYKYYPESDDSTALHIFKSTADNIALT